MSKISIEGNASGTGTLTIFFKAQRGEATMEDWQAKVAEIKAMFPKE